MMMGPQECENKDCYLKKKERRRQESQYMVGRAVAAANVGSIAKLLYSISCLPWSKFGCYICFFFNGGGYGEHSIFNDIL